MCGVLRNSHECCTSVHIHNQHFASSYNYFKMFDTVAKKFISNKAGSVRKSSVQSVWMHFFAFFLSNLISNAYIKDVSDPLMYVGLAYVCHFYFCAEFWLCLPWGTSCKECLQEILFWRQSGFCKKGPQSKVLPTFTK